ncbi:MAG TPA: hydrogenase maturation protease [Candidatus Binatia bacterium]|nr:hydrogenase maturation protease [Candidatus Binatia bacterium]
MGEPVGEKVVIGIGNDGRGDDAVGLLVARRLLERGLSGISIRELRGDPTLLLDIWENAETVILIDALRSGAAPGTLHRLDGERLPIDEKIFRFSTHGTSIAAAVELARALGRLPRRLIIYGIEGKRFGVGEGVSPKVERCIDKAVGAIAEDLRVSALEP